MTDTLFGAAVPSGYSTDPDKTAVTNGTVFYVRGGQDGWTAKGARQLTGSGSLNLAGCWAYLYGLGPTELLAVKQFPTDLAEGAWNEVLFDTPQLLTVNPGGRYYVVCVYLPHGGYAYKTGVFTTNVFSSNTNLIGPEAGDAFASGPIAGNGVFFAGTIGDPAHPPAQPTFLTSVSNFHYGVDVTVQDPANAPPEPPSNTVAPVITGLPQSGRPLSCSTGSWLGTYPITYSRQWQRDNVDIVGATAPTYTLTDDDATHDISCVVTAFNSIGSATTETAAVTIDLAPPPPGANAILRVKRNGQWKKVELGDTTVGISLRPESFGAKRDGETDDTAAITQCIAAAVQQAQQEGTFFCEVLFSPGIYQLDAPTTVGGATLGNAQIPLPVVVPETDQKVILRLKGCGKASALHWAQEQPLVIGTVLRSSLTGQTSAPTYGAPSILGAPTVQVGSNPLAPYFSNMHVVIDGLTVMAPMNPSLVGLDLRGLGQASVLDLATMVDAIPTDFAGNMPTNGLGVALMMPSPGNNAVCDIGYYSCEGWTTAMTIAEHVVAQRVLAVFCDTAVFVNTIRSASTNHASTIQYLLAEVVNTVVATDEQNNIKFGLNIDTCDLEITDTGTHINDPTNMLRGQINWHDYQYTAPRVTGAGNIRIVDMARDRGNATAPAVPATTVALRNPFWRDAAVTITGGTVTVIAVDGVASGLTSGTVVVPTGRTVTITHSSAPTWKWTLL